MSESYSDNKDAQQHPILQSLDEMKRKLATIRTDYDVCCGKAKQHRYQAKQFDYKANMLATQIREMQLELETLQDAWKQAELNKITEEKFLPLVNQYLEELTAAKSIHQRQLIQKKYDEIGLPVNLVISYLENQKKEENG